jgi:thiamine kinase-like enzyme
MPDRENFPARPLTMLADIIGRLSARLGELEGEPVPLAGGITNRNYRARFGGSDVVVRLPGRDTDLLGIDREAERAAGELAALVGVGPEVVELLEEPPCLVTAFVEGEALTPEELRGPGAMEEVAAALRRLHGSGEELPSIFSPYRIAETYAARIVERGGMVPKRYEWAAEQAQTIETTLSGRGHAPVPCHNDLLAANFILAPAGSAGPVPESRPAIKIVDWEYAGMGDRYFDLGNFAVNNGLDEEGEAALLSAYFGATASARRLARLRLMRFMSDFREAMWGALQRTISDLEFDFDDYCEEHFARMREFAAGGRLERLLEEAGGAAS